MFTPGQEVTISGAGPDRPKGKVVAVGTKYNVHGHASRVVSIEWPSGTVTTWAERDVLDWAEWSERMGI